MSGWDAASQFTVTPVSPIIRFGRRQVSALDLSQLQQAIEVGLEQLDELAPDRAHQLARYLVMLDKWNQRIGLTAIKDPQQMVVRHILDSVAIARWLSGGRIADVGTGPGLPGIPLAVVRPDKHFCLLDSRNRRIQFVRQACWDIGISNTEAVAERVESYRPENKFDTLVARAFSSLDRLRLCTQALCQPGTRLVAMKGRLPQEEIDALPCDVQESLTVEKVHVPGLDSQRHVVVFSV